MTFKVNEANERGFESGHKSAVRECSEIVDEVVRDHRWGKDGSCGINTAIKSAIKKKFGLEI